MYIERVPHRGSRPAGLLREGWREDGKRGQRRAGLDDSPRTLVEAIGRIQSTDVVLPLADAPGCELRLRCVVGPDTAQAWLLDRLGLRLPERLRPRPLVAGKSCRRFA